MSTTPATNGTSASILCELDRIARATPRTAIRTAAAPGLLGRMLGKAQPFGDTARLQLEASDEVDARVAVIVAHRLVNGERRDVARLLPEALINATLPDDGEERFMTLADAARGVVRRHLDRTLLGADEDDLRGVKLRAVVKALEAEGSQTLTERLQAAFNACWAQHVRFVKDAVQIANEDPILVEIDNVALGDVAADGTMPYSMDVVVDGHPLATVASPGDGSLTVRAWLGPHGPDDLEALRHHVARYGRPRSDEHGERPDSLEEMLLDRVTSLFTRFTFQQEMVDAVLFCDPEPGAPGGNVIRIAPIGPDDGSREDVWAAVLEGYPRAVLLDRIAPDDAFTLWLAYSGA